MKHLLKLLKEKKMLVIGGTGGVGKTTLSCALALKAAKLGRKTLVLTIDPAKRLATTLGLDIKRDEPQKVKMDPPAPLWAMVLNTQKTFDALIRKYAPSQEITDKILSNRIYQYLASSMAGTEEYMALEKLYELHETKAFDFIVLDTPPTQHAVSFLNAPDRLTNFLDENTMKWFLKPSFKAGKLGLKLFSSGSKIFSKVLERVTGLKILQDLAEFLISLQTFYQGFKERTQKAKTILSHTDTSFFIVTHPETTLLQQALTFQEHLLQKNIHMDAILMNRVTSTIPLSPEEKDEMDALDIQKFSKSDQMVFDIFQSYENLAQSEKKEIQAFQEQLPKDVHVFEIPFFEEDIYDIKGLNRLNLHIF
ncbi:MAG: hypothetical protein A3B70_01815 [Deltaproteobacteria bacterium RIFCSPHIGHO2_02_FULL_40_11]|nr:MAG: hypothetical protein A3B70_01815 [Deltaproteobacteria bacterium RIFCSPHIGHO2_02_FULL_40_11]